jgi:hypothetical protein
MQLRYLVEFLFTLNVVILPSLVDFSFSMTLRPALNPTILRTGIHLESGHAPISCRFLDPPSGFVSTNDAVAVFVWMLMRRLKAESQDIPYRYEG